MAQRVTNEELFNRGYAAAEEAADKLTMLADSHREQRQPLTLPQVTQVRNLLRTAYCAAQELKQRMKKEEGRMQNGEKQKAECRMQNEGHG